MNAVSLFFGDLIDFMDADAAPTHDRYTLVDVDPSWLLIDSRGAMCCAHLLTNL